MMSTYQTHPARLNTKETGISSWNQGIDSKVQLIILEAVLKLDALHHRLTFLRFSSLYNDGADSPRVSVMERTEALLKYMATALS